MRINRADKFEQYQEYEKMRYKRDPQRKAMNLAWAKTEKGKASHAKSVAIRNAADPEKRAANILVGNAVRDGRLKKPSICSRCGAVPPRRQLHAHHHDYYNPLDVEWICSECHGLEHYGEAPLPPKFNKIRGKYVARDLTK